MGWEIIGLPGIVSIAIVATLGYLVGRRPAIACVEENCARQEMKRAKAVLHQLAAISQQMRQSLAQHHSTVLQFKTRLDRFQARNDSLSLRELTVEADRLLAPTQELASAIADAYEGIRRQTMQLAHQSRLHIDSLTGVGNRWSLDENLKLMLGLRQKCNVPFSLAVFEIEDFRTFTNREGRRAAEALLREMATLLDTRSRESDLVARLEEGRFAVLLSQTDAAGAEHFAARMQQYLLVGLPTTTLVQVTEATDHDDPASLLARTIESLQTAEKVNSVPTTPTGNIAHRDQPHRQVPRRTVAIERTESETPVAE